MPSPKPSSLATRAEDIQGIAPTGLRLGPFRRRRHRGQLGRALRFENAFFLERITNSNNLRIVDEQQSDGHTADLANRLATEVHPNENARSRCPGEIEIAGRFRGLSGQSQRCWDP